MTSRNPAATHLRQAVAELRAAKTSLGKARGLLRAGPIDTKLSVQPRAVLDVEMVLLKAARQLEHEEPVQMEAPL